MIEIERVSHLLQGLYLIKDTSENNREVFCISNATLRFQYDSTDRKKDVYDVYSGTYFDFCIDSQLMLLKEITFSFLLIQ